MRISTGGFGGVLTMVVAVVFATGVAAAPVPAQHTLGSLLAGASPDHVGALVYSNSTLRGDTKVVLQINEDPATALDVLCENELGNGTLRSVVYYYLNGTGPIRLDQSRFAIKCSSSVATITIDARELPEGTVFRTRFMLTHDSGIVTASWKNLNKKGTVTSQGQSSQQVAI